MRRLVRPLAALAVAALPLGGFTGAPARRAKAATLTVEVPSSSPGPAGPTGGIRRVRVRVETPKPGRGGVRFTEHAVGGTGEQWRAAGWDAVAAATLLTGVAPGAHVVSFDVTGRLEGASAGALLTVAVVSLLRGDHVRQHVTMTGTVAPDGAVGPVGGVAEKLDGARRAHIRRLLVPAGQTTAADNGEQPADVVALGRRLGVAVVEVRDLDHAYPVLTGRHLPRPAPVGPPTLDPTRAVRLRSRAQEWLDRYRESRRGFSSLDPQVQPDVQPLLDRAATAATRSAQLGERGLVGGAYSAATEAAEEANAAVNAGRAEHVYLAQGPGPLADEVRSSSGLAETLARVGPTLVGARPVTLADDATLLDAYGELYDGLSLAAHSNAVLERLARGDAPTEPLMLATTAAVDAARAGTRIDVAGEMLEIDIGRTGPAPAGGRSSQEMTSLLRATATADLAAFDSLVLPHLSGSEDADVDAIRLRLGSVDPDYAAVSGSAMLPGGAMSRYAGDSRSAADAELAGALRLYARSSTLVAVYASFGPQLDGQLAITAFGSPVSLGAMLDGSGERVAHALALVRTRGVDPVLGEAAAEAGPAERGAGAPGARLALGAARRAFVEAAVLAARGGFAPG
jgi:uncharacterized protein